MTNYVSCPNAYGKINVGIDLLWIHMDSLLSGFLTSYCVWASLDVVQNEASTQKVDNLLDINCYLSKCRHWRKNTTLNTWLQRKFYCRWRILSSACHMFIFRLFTMVLNEIDCYCDVEVIMRLMCTQKNKSHTFTKMSCLSFWWYFSIETTRILLSTWIV